MSQQTFKVGFHSLMLKGKADASRFSESSHWTQIEADFTKLAEWIGKGHAWMPAILDDGMPRRQVYANRAEVLGIDVDNQTTDKAGNKQYLHQMTMQEALEHPFIKQYCGLGIASASHKPGRDKYRLVFRPRTPITGWRNIRISNLYISYRLDKHKPTENTIADPACKDASRFFYGAEGAKPFILDESKTLPESFLQDAIAWHEEKLRQEEEEELIRRQKAEEYRALYGEKSSDEQLAEIERALACIPARTQQGGGLYPVWMACTAGLVHEFGESTAIQLIERYCPSSKKIGWDVSKLVSSLARKPGGKTYGVGTIFHHAKDYGWRPEKKERKTIVSKTRTVEKTAPIKKKTAVAVIEPVITEKVEVKPEPKTIDFEAIQSRDAEYRKIAALDIPFDKKQIEFFTDKGVSVEQIAKLKSTGKLICVNGLNPSDFPKVPAWAQGTGILMTAQNLAEQIIGARQLTGNNAEIWDRNAYSDSELPLSLNVLHGQGKGTFVLFVNEFLRSIVLAQLIESKQIPASYHTLYIVGAAGGQFAGSEEQVKELLAFTNATPILIPDAGSFANPHVMANYMALSTIVPELQYANWKQGFDKTLPDADEAFGIKILSCLNAFSPSLLGKVLIGNGVYRDATADDARKVRSVNPELTKIKSTNKETIVVRSIALPDGSIYAPTAGSFIQTCAEFGDALKFAYSYKYLNDVSFIKTCNRFPQIVIEHEDGRQITWVVTQKMARLEAESTRHTFSAKHNANCSTLLQAMLEGGAIALRAGLGTGKSYLAAQAAEEFERVLGITPRNELGKQLAESLGAVTQLTASQSQQTDRIVTTAASLKEEGGYMSALTFKYDTIVQTFTTDGAVVVGDEIESTLTDLTTGEINAKGRKEKLDTMLTILKTAKHLWLMDGNLSPWTIDLLKSLRPDFKFFENTRKNMEDRDLYQVPDRASALHMIVEMVRANKRVAIAVDNARINIQNNSAEGLYELIKRMEGLREKVAVITSDTQAWKDHKCFDINPKNIGQYQVIIYTSVWESGISIDENEKFDAVFGLFTGVSTPDVCYQMLNRVRHGCPRYVFAKRSVGEQESRINQGVIEHLKEMLIEASDDAIERELTAGNAIDDSNFVFQALTEAASAEITLDPNSALGKWERENTAYHNACNASYRATILSLAQLAGYTLRDIPNLPSKAEARKTWKEFCVIAVDEQERGYEHVVEAESLTAQRAAEIRKGAKHTMSEGAAMVKFPVEHDTKGAVTMETTHEVRVYKGTNEMKGINALCQLVLNQAEEIKNERIDAIVTANHKGSYLADNKRVTQADRVFWTNSLFGNLIRNLIDECKDNPSFINAETSENFAAIVRTIETNFDSYKKVFRTTSKGKDFTQVAVAMLKRLGIEIVRKRTKHGMTFRFLVPTLTQRVIEYRTGTAAQP